MRPCLAKQRSQNRTKKLKQAGFSQRDYKLRLCFIHILLLRTANIVFKLALRSNVEIQITARQNVKK
jgi:hypothetical protein